MLQLLCAGPVNLHDSRLVVALDSHIPENDDIRLQARTRGLLDIQTFWHYFHETFMRSSTPPATKSRSSEAALSPHDCECISLAARDMTTEDNAIKLDIRSRTVQFRFDDTCAKIARQTVRRPLQWRFRPESFVSTDVG